MAIVLKVAESAQELRDVYWVRHEVYVVEDHKFSGAVWQSEQIVDRFDSFPGVANIIAYESGDPVGTIRLNLDEGVGLPSEEYFDFTPFRVRAKAALAENFVLGSAGMLAVREKWRRRRDVIMALFKLAAGVGYKWNLTHGIATVAMDTASIYGRMGFAQLSEPIWIEEIGNNVIPMAGPFEPAYKWAFGHLLDSNLDRFWLDSFSGHFERVLLTPGEILFKEGDVASAAYIVDDGWMSLSRRDPEERELTLATLSRGSLFGELGLIDNEPRSATACATTHVELISIERACFLKKLRADSESLERLLRVFAQRLRKTDDLATIMAYAPQTGRVKFALNELRRSAVPDPKRNGAYFVKLGPKDVAKKAGVREYEVLRVLEAEKSEGVIDYGEQIIRFFR